MLAPRLMNRGYPISDIFYDYKDSDFIFASYLVRFVPNENLVLSKYLTTFLNTKFGIWDIKRRARHSINQTNTPN